MGRRDPDPRPEVEVLGADRGVVSSQTVEVGRPGPRRSRTTGGALALLAVGLLLVGLATSDDGAPAASKSEGDSEDAQPTATSTPRRSTSTRPRGTTTLPPTPTTLPSGPLFDQPVGGALLIFSNRRWTHVDMATGARREVRLPTDSPYGAVAVPGGIVLHGISRDGPGATYYDLSDDEPEGVFLGSADRVLRSSRSDQVWLIHDRHADFGRSRSDRPLAVLVDLTGQVEQSIQVPELVVHGAVESGVVTARGGRVFIADGEGVEPVAVGELVAAAGTTIVLSACDEQASCGIQVLDLVTGRVRNLAWAPTGTEVYGYSATLAFDGRLALTSYGDEVSGPSLVMVDPATGAEAAFDLGVVITEPQWLPGDLGLLVFGPGGTRRLQAVDGGVLAETVSGLRDLRPEVAYVLDG